MRLKTGISGFDDLIEGGLIKNQTYIVCGPPGSGRTTFGIQFLVEGAKQNENGLYVAFTETPANIIKFMSRFNFDLVNLVKGKKIYFMNGTQELFEEFGKRVHTEEAEIFDLSAEQTSPKSFFEKIEPIIKKTPIERLVIDSTTALSFLGKSRENDTKQLARYINLLKQMDVTVVLLSEIIEHDSYNLEHYLSQGIIFLHHFPEDDEADMARAIQVIKMRGTKHPSNMFPISFTNNGLTIETGKMEDFEITENND